MGQNIGEVSEPPISKAIPFFESVELSPAKAKIAQPILKEILDRLTFMANVGVEYLTRVEPPDAFRWRGAADRLLRRSARTFLG